MVHNFTIHRVVLPMYCLLLFYVILGARAESDSFWKVHVKKNLITKFRPVCLSSAESSPDYLLNRSLDYVALFQRLQTKTGVRA